MTTTRSPTAWRATRSMRWSSTSAARPTRCSPTSRPDGHWVFELEADATIPAEYVLMVHYFAEAAEPRAGAQDRRLSAPHPGRAWRLAAVPRGRLRHEREREGLFRAQDDRRRHQCAAHAPRARGDPVARRRREEQRVHPRAALALRRDPVEQRAGDAGRDHAAAEVVSVPSRQDLVLGAHRDRAAAGAAGAEAEGDQSARRDDRRAVPPGPEDGRRRRTRRRTRSGRGSSASAASTSCCARSSRIMPKRTRKRAIDKAVAFVDRAAQRHRRARRDLSGDGELA